MNTFCTIISADYVPFARALYKSLYKYDPDVQLQVLVADVESFKPGLFSTYPGIQLHFIHGFRHYGLVDELYKKFAHINMDHFRWSLKPVFISYLLEHGFEKVLYVDCDIFFFHDYSFLFKELDTCSVLLTPHWRNSDPLRNEESFISLFTCGIFNAGFVGSNRSGLDALHWWARACHFKMGDLVKQGIYDDQRYLDVLPVKFEGVKIIRHKGCNVATWNQSECERIIVNGKVLINGKYPVVFIHMNQMLITEILKGHDAALLPFFMEFRNTFEEDGAQLASFTKGLNYHLHPNRLLRLKWRIKLRTRIKSFFFQAR